MSVVTFGELRHGAEKSQAREKALANLERLSAAIQVLGLPPEAGTRYGQIRAALEQAGRPIGNNDLWIASHACAAGLVLVTNNEREFARVEGLRIENWAG
jgi:tRNA(fMet)-specific endonuclease VapC